MRNPCSAALCAALVLLVTPTVGEGLGADHRASENSRSGSAADGITLEQAVQKALENQPSVFAGLHRVAAAAARVTQAGVLPNPELELEAENFGGRGDLSGFNAAESTAVLSQKLLLGGKRKYRREVAESEAVLAEIALQSVRLDVVEEVSSSFFEVLAAQQRVALAEELLGLAERFSASVAVRVEAGKVSPIEETRASIEVARTRVAMARSKRELAASRARLAAAWGSPMVDFVRVVGELPTPVDPPAREWLFQSLAATPEMIRLGEQDRRMESAVELARSLRVPDLTVSAGPRRYEETGESAWVAGVSLPIPIFDRNQGARQAAELDLETGRRRNQAVRVAAQAELAVVLERLRAVTAEVESLSREIVPAAESAFAATETGYLGGKLGFLDVLDAQRSLFDARSMLLSSREEYALTRVKLERLIGRTLETSTPEHSASVGGVQ
jgi:cobalt-zinc-cadmium efflux system outer membrane protein